MRSIIIPRELKKSPQLKGIKITDGVIAITPYFLFMIVLSKTSILLLISSIILGIIIITNFNNEPLYKTLILHLKSIGGKKYYFRDREIYLYNKFHYEKKVLKKPVTIVEKIMYPYKFVFTLLKNQVLMFSSTRKRLNYHLKNYQEYHLDQSEYDDYSYKIDDYMQFIMISGSNEYVVKKLIPTKSKFFNTESERDNFYPFLRDFYESYANLKLYKFHNQPVIDENYIDLLNNNRDDKRIFKLFKNIQYKKLEKYSKMLVPNFFVVLPYNGEKITSVTNEALKIIDCTLEDKAGIDCIIRQNIGKTQEIEFDVDHIKQINNENHTTYTRYYSLNKLALKQNELYIEKLLMESQYDVLIDYRQYKKDEIASVLSNSSNESLSRLNTSENILEMSEEKQEILKLAEYSELLTNDQDIIIGIDITLKLETDKFDDLDEIEANMQSYFKSLNINPSLFIQKQKYNHWSCVNNVVENGLTRVVKSMPLLNKFNFNLDLVKINYRQLSLGDFIAGGLFNYSKIEDKNGYIQYLGYNGLINFSKTAVLPEENRLTRSSFISGVTGGGKSTLLKNFILQYANEDMLVYNLDLQGDFIWLFKAIGGESVHMGKGVVINPLQIDNWYSTNSDKSENEYDLNRENEKVSKVSLETALNRHLVYLKTFFEISGANTEMQNELIYLLFNFYKEKYPNLNADSKSNEYPIFSDFYEYLQSMSSGNDILKFIHQFSHSIYEEYFNRYTNVDLSNKRINFVVNEIKNKDSILDLAMFTILSIMRNAIYMDIGCAKAIIFDEAHRLQRSKAASIFLDETIREVRKFNAIIDVSSQSPSDITETMRENVQYKFYLKTKNMEPIYNELDKTKDELPNLVHANFGVGLLEMNNEIYPIDYQMEKYEMIENAEFISICDSKPLILNDMSENKRKELFEKLRLEGFM